MYLALVDGIRKPPSVGLNGTCPVCSDRMIAKCGEARIHHWAHYARRHCDQWWEPEEAWHREWKNRFPFEWQEVIHHDRNGDRHVADVRTEHGLVIEFQHSYLDPAERRRRETFYGNMVWVVDGTRLVGDLPRFIHGIRSCRATRIRGFLAHLAPEVCFPRSWLDSSKMVLFDFGRDPERILSSDVDGKLWCLLPGRADGRAIFGALPRSEFARLALKRSYILQADAIIALFDQHYRDRLRQRKQPKFLRNPATLIGRWHRYGNRRRPRPRGPRS